MLPKELYKRIPVLIFYFAVLLFALYLLFRFVFPVFFPFIVSWFIALLLQKPVGFLCEKIHLPRKLASILLVIFFVALFGLICWLVLSRTYEELSFLAENIGSFIEKSRKNPEYAADLIKRIDSAIPFVDLSEILESLDVRIENALGNLLVSLSSKILPILGDIASMIPEVVMAVFITVVSSYYFTVGFDKINRFFVSLMPKSIRKYFSLAKRETVSTLGKLFKAYGIIILITFTELFISLSLIRVKYSLVIAFLTSLIDILPILGTGTVLIPWGIVLLLMGQTRKGIAILIVYAVITIIRELIEPRIIGKTMGVDPLIMLIAMYAGLQIFGFFGLLFVPTLVTFVSNIIKKAGIDKKLSRKTND